MKGKQMQILIILSIFIGFMLFGGLTVSQAQINEQDAGRTYKTVNQGSVNEIGLGYGSDGTGTPSNADGTGFYRIEFPAGSISDSAYDGDGIWVELGNLAIGADISGAAGQGLSWDGGNLELDVNAGNGIQISGDDVAVDVNDFVGAGLEVSGTDLAVSVGTGMTIFEGDVAFAGTYTTVSSNDGDTDVTGAELETLSDTSDADSLHTHNTLVNDGKVKVDSGATPDYLGAASNDGALRTGTGLTYTDGGDYVTIARDKTTYVVTYDLAQPADDQQIVANRTWADETLNVGDLANQVDYPRRLTVTATNMDPSNMTGTVTINGKDADGTVIADVRTVNVAPGPPVVYITDYAFSLVTTIVTDQTDAHIGDTYSVGTLDYWGVPNYPLAAAGDVFKAAIGGVDAGIDAVIIAYGTVDLGGIGVGTTPVVIFYQSAK